MKGVSSSRLISCWTRRVQPRSVEPRGKTCFQPDKKLFASLFCSSVRQESDRSVLSCFQKPNAAFQMLSADRSALTSCSSQRGALGSVLIAIADIFNSLTRMRAVVPGLFRANSRGYICTLDLMSQ